MSQSFPLGASYQGEQQCSFVVWAPKVPELKLHLLTPSERIVPLKPDEHGYHETLVEGVEPGARYLYCLQGGVERPDPASRFQPVSVHGPSEIVDPSFDWTDQGWFGLPLRDHILYELHVGTFTPDGTFEAIIPHLAQLQDLGITALELMPVAQFPGNRNWGYDGAYPFAAQNSYGGARGLKKLVNACHQAGIAVVLDVVYNHLGPEGNYLREFGHYFTDRYLTPWGAALNFDGHYCDEVRRYFFENALYWQTECHLDGLRLDAVHAIRDFSATPFLRELARITRRRSEEVNRRFHLIAESDLNDSRVILPEELGGYGLDAQWSDDFHHCLHVLITGEHDGYYEDFGGTKLFAKVLREGWGYNGQYSAFRKRRHGNSPQLNSAQQFVVFSQNHDQVGNRFLGERLTRLASFEGLKLAAGSVLLSPFVPLLFMGEEYGESAPFQYIISHGDPQLVEAVRQGRREEFAAFSCGADAPDPQAESTFQQCILNRELSRTVDFHRALFGFYRELIRLRKQTPALAQSTKGSLAVEALERERVVWLLYAADCGPVCVLFCFSEEPVSPTLDLPAGTWRRLLDSDDERWGGRGGLMPDRLSSSGRVTCKLNPKSVVVFQRVHRG